jgi:hypothetical protein
MDMTDAAMMATIAMKLRQLLCILFMDMTDAVSTAESCNNSRHFHGEL